MALEIQTTAGIRILNKAFYGIFDPSSDAGIELPQGSARAVILGGETSSSGSVLPFAKAVEEFPGIHPAPAIVQPVIAGLSDLPLFLSVKHLSRMPEMQRTHDHLIFGPTSGPGLLLNRLAQVHVINQEGDLFRIA